MSDTYTLEIVRDRMPFVVTFTPRFAGAQLMIDSEPNLGSARRTGVGRTRAASATTN